MNSDPETEPELEVVGRAMVLSPIPRSVSWAGEGPSQQQGVAECQQGLDLDVEASQLQDVFPVRAEMQLMTADMDRVSTSSPRMVFSTSTPRKGESSSLLVPDPLDAFLDDTKISAKKVFTAQPDAELVSPDGTIAAKQRITASMPDEKRDWHAAIRQCLKRRVRSWIETTIFSKITLQRNFLILSLLPVLRHHVLPRCEHSC